MYDNLHDAGMRLTGSIIRFRGMPVYVQRCDHHPDGGVGLKVDQCCPPYDSMYLRMNDPDIDVSSAPLGYIDYPTQYGMSCVYAVRMPSRKQVQGIAPSRIQLYMNGTRSPARNNLGIDQIGKCILGEVMGYEQYLLVVATRKSQVVSLSRHVAAGYKKLYYMAHEIGDIKHEKGEHIVTITSPSFNYYNFEEVLNGYWRFNRA